MTHEPVRNTRMIHGVIAFVRWADSFHRPITPQDVMNRWDVSRATAYRWLRGYDAAGGGKPVSIGGLILEGRPAATVGLQS